MYTPRPHLYRITRDFGRRLQTNEARKNWHDRRIRVDQKRGANYPIRAGLRLQDSARLSASRYTAHKARLADLHRRGSTGITECGPMSRDRYDAFNHRIENVNAPCCENKLRDFERSETDLATKLVLRYNDYQEGYGAGCSNEFKLQTRKFLDDMAQLINNVSYGLGRGRVDPDNRLLLEMSTYISKHPDPAGAKEVICDHLEGLGLVVEPRLLRNAAPQ